MAAITSVKNYGGHGRISSGDQEFNLESVRLEVSFQYPSEDISGLQGSRS